MQREASYFILGDLPAQARTIVDVNGPDALRFLQGLLTADVAAIEAGEARPAALLTVKGKIISEVIVLRHGEGFALAIPRDVAASVLADLERHVIMDDVTLTRHDERALALVWPAFSGAGEGVRAYACAHPAPGTLVAGETAALAAALGGATRVDAAAFERLRIASGAPAWRREIEDDTFPPEVGFVAAVSYEKGCFRGQEPLARIHARGQVNRVMVRVRADAAPPEAVGLAAEGRPDAGRWTSWSAGEAGVDGLAVVHRSVAVPGTRLRAGEIGVEVVSGPVGDDPGVKGRREAAPMALGRRG